MRLLVLRIWWWITGRKRVLMNDIYMPVDRMIQPVLGRRKLAGTRVAIRNAIRKTRTPKKPGKRRRDIDREYLEHIRVGRKREVA